MKEKSQQTKLKKYGDPFYTNNQKSRQTKFEKYGNEFYFNIDKARQTKLKRYGNTSNFHGINSQKIKNIKLLKYGSLNNIEKIKHTRFISFYNKLFSSDRLKEKITPLFSLSEYKGRNGEYSWKCNSCSTEFIDNIENGKIPRCPTCFPKLGGISLLEKELSDWIKSLNIEIKENIKNIIAPLELDIYIPDYNLAIEFDGIYWHSELRGVNKNYHLNKTNKCQEKGIQLLHIFEDEWLDKQKIIKSIIKSKLGIFDSVVSGRECVLKEISSLDANEFFYENHIQGSCLSKINLGLFHKDRLISTLSFTKSRFNKKYDWEITRFANKLNYKIHGSFGKMMKYFIKNYGGSVITFSDKRLFTGKVYKLYFQESKDSPPNYWYVKNRSRYNRIIFQKHKLKNILEKYDENLTEWQNMQLNEYDRIWDCGNRVFIHLPSQS